MGNWWDFRDSSIVWLLIMVINWLCMLCWGEWCVGSNMFVWLVLNSIFWCDWGMIWNLMV